MQRSHNTEDQCCAAAPVWVRPALCCKIKAEFLLNIQPALMTQAQRNPLGSVNLNHTPPLTLTTRSDNFRITRSALPAGWSILSGWCFVLASSLLQTKQNCKAAKTKKQIFLFIYCEVQAAAPAADLQRPAGSRQAVSGTLWSRLSLEFSAAALSFTSFLWSKFSLQI